MNLYTHGYTYDLHVSRAADWGAATWKVAKVLMSRSQIKNGFDPTPQRQFLRSPQRELSAAILGTCQAGVLLYADHRRCIRVASITNVLTDRV